MATHSHSDRKIAEGLEHIRNAEKCLKTGMFKWKPDNDGAAMEFQKAGVAFRVAKAFDQAISVYTRAADVQKEMGSWFHAAKSLESAAAIYKEQGEEMKACDLVEKASGLYLQHGTPDTAALALERAAKMVEQKNYQRAVQLYMRAVDVCEGEDRPRQCAEMVGRACRLLIRHKRLDDAAKALNQEMEYYSQVDHNGVLNKLVMGLVLVHLHRGDFVAADQAFKKSLSYPGFAQSDEAGPIQILLQAYDEGDDTTAYECLHNPLFRYMENDFTKLARDLRVPGGEAAVNPSSKDGAVSPAGDEDDDYSGGLL